jgi:hypothetical protein
MHLCFGGTHQFHHQDLRKAKEVVVSRLAYSSILKIEATLSPPNVGSKLPDFVQRIASQRTDARAVRTQKPRQQEPLGSACMSSSGVIYRYRFVPGKHNESEEMSV